MPSTDDSKSGTPTPSPSSETPTYRMDPGTFSTPALPVRYHYAKASPVNLPRSNSVRVLQPRRNATSEEAIQVTATIGRVHKNHFSVGSTTGAQPDKKPSSPHQSDPRTIRSPKEIHQTQFGEDQGPRALPLPGASGARIILKALEPKAPSENLRNYSTTSLKLKLPRIRLNRPKNPYGERPKTSPGFSSRPQSPSTGFSPVSGTRPWFSDDTFNVLGPMHFEKSGSSNTYLIPRQPPDSEEGSHSSLNPPPFSAVSTISQQDSLPQTPGKIRSGVFRPESPAAHLELMHPHREEGELKYNEAFHRDNVPSSVIRSAEFLQTRTRPFPTTTQDDMSLNSQGEHKSLNQFSRRASLSTTSMMSSSSTTLQGSTSTSHNDGSDNHHRQSITNTSDPGNKDLPRTPTASHPISRNRSDSSLQNDEDTLSTPIAIVHTGMPFSHWVDDESPNPSHQHRPSSAQLRSPSQKSSSEVNVSLRDSTSDASSRAPRPQTARQRNKVSPEEIAQWEKEREIATQEVLHLYEGEACVIRFEPKHKWMGVWNRPDIEEVIMGLRDLRSPRV